MAPRSSARDEARTASDDAAARASLLHRLTIEVSRAPDAVAAGRAVVQLGRGLLGGRSSVLWLVDSTGSLDLVASDGVPDSFIAQWQRVHPDDDLPAIHAVRGGKPLWVSSLDEYQEVDPTVAAKAQVAMRPLAFAALPLQFEGRNLGVIVFGYAAPHPFDDDERTLTLAIAGNAAQALERVRLQAAQARVIAGLRVIAKVSEMVSASLDVDNTLTALAEAVVPDVADWCAVDLFTDGHVHRLTVHHADPEKVERAREYVRRYPTRLDDPNDSLARIHRTGEPVWARRITPDMLASAIVDPTQRELLASLGLRSSVQTPLFWEGSVRGVVTFAMSESGREYDEIDRDLLVEIGRRAEHSLTNATRYAREQRARDRMSRLATVTAKLARASTTPEVGRVACSEGAAALDASSAVLYALDGDRLRLVAEFGPRGDLAERYREVPLTAAVPVTRVIARQAPVDIESYEELVREFPEFAESRRATGTGYAIMAKPLTDRFGRIAGALAFEFTNARSFGVEDRDFARTLAGYCAQAFDRARILDSERRAAERLALLAAAGEAFSVTIDYEATLRLVVRCALPMLGDFGFFDFIEEDGEVRRTSWAPDDASVEAVLSDPRWLPPEQVGPHRDALSSATVDIHPDVDEEWLRHLATTGGHLAVLAELRPRSVITVPLVARGGTIGALTVCHQQPGRRHTDGDLELAMELARRGATAVEHARLYRASRDAAKRAEEANRMKDEFLAVVSHELRTPLNAILGWAHLLDDARSADPIFRARGLEVIRRNAQAQREIVDDILDVSRIISGKLRITPVPVDLANLVRDALDVVRPAANAKGVRLESTGCDGEVLVVGDGPRLQQVVWNLLSNAVKFTGSGGTVRTELRTGGQGIVVRVSDDGIGMDASLVPFVFDRFRQADSSSTRAQGGLGLGLSIVRHLVELHGGTVSAASAGPGKGSTFEVVLPVRAGQANRSSPGRATSRSGTTASKSLFGLRILVVDDDADSRELVGLFLQQAGATVVAAANAEEAIAAFEREPIDVVVSDVAMPQVDGYALLGMLQHVAEGRRRPLRAIALTAHGRAEDRAAALRAGFSAHLTKPVMPTALLSCIDRLRNMPGSLAPR